jgi:hypothetical protein
MPNITYMGPPRKRRRKKKAKRPDESYLTAAHSMAPLVPRMRKYRRRKTLTRSEKSAIAKRERQLKNIPFLVPLTKAQARRVGRKKLFMGGVQAIQLRNVKPGDKITFKKGGDIEIKTQQGRWIYWALDRDTVRSRRGMRKAGADAFAKKFPIEKVSELTELAFRQFEVQQVNLWAHAGIVGDPFKTVEAFIRWVNEKWNAGRYIRTEVRVGGDIYESPSDPGKWVNGIAILIANPEYTRRRKEIEKEAQKNR